MKINGLTIPHPVVFARRERELPRVGAGTSARVKPTVVHKPSNPRAKYAMPIIPIVAAIATIAAGATVAAGVGIAAMVAGGAMMIGGALVIIGTITDRPNLVKWGGILSIAGGIGAAYLGATGALTAGESAATTGGELTVPPGATPDVPLPTEVPGQATQLGGPGTGGIPEVVTPPPPAPQPPPPAPPVAQAPSGLLASEAPPAAGATPPPLTQTATDALGPQGPTAFRPTGPAEVLDRSTFATPSTGNAANGYWDAAGRWVRANPETARAGFQAATGLLASAVPRPMNAAEQAAAEESRRRAARMDPNSTWWRQQPRAG